MYKIANEAHTDIRQLKFQQPEILAMTVNKLLEKNMDNRYQTGQQLIIDLNKCLIGLAHV